MISASNLAKSYGDRTLFAGVSLQLNAGERYGLVGANGSGKTTLLRILAGDLDASEGEVAVPKRATLGVLRQDQFIHDSESILSVALMGNRELWRAMSEKEKLLARAEEEFDADRFSELEEVVMRHDGYSAEARAATILEGLGLPTAVHHDPISTLSGGFRLRVLLAQVLASSPDALLLDEPTNHLDILSIRWLETFLRDYSGMVLVISHDHRFLDNVCTTILDVDYQTVTPYPGDYSGFMKAKPAERERREKELASRQKEIDHHQKFVDRFRAKASKARQAQSKLRLIERKAEDLVELPQSSRQYPTFRFEQRRDCGREVLSVKHLSKAYGDNQVLRDVSLAVNRGDRLAIMGANGIGKSTLLKIITGNLQSDGGTVTWGYETYPGYFAQDQKEQFDSADMTAEEWIWRVCPEKDLGFVRGRMGLMLFTGDDGKKKLGALSGGESSRLVFARLGIQKPNVLVLDEPTNHLDLESIEALVDGLQTYAGTVIFVSHDRWFVSQLATRVMEIRRDEIVDYPGSYDDYVHSCGDDHLDVDRVVLKAKKQKRTAARMDRPKGDRAKERQATGDLEKARARLAEVTAKLEKTEARVAEIDQMFCQPDYFSSTPAELVKAARAERDGLQQEVAVLVEEWERLEQEIAGLETEAGTAGPA